MAIVKFTEVTDPDGLASAFDYIRSAKSHDSLDEAALKSALSPEALECFVDLGDPQFSCLTQADMMARIGERWDFASWVDALNAAEIEYIELLVCDGAGTLEFAQHSWPSGGIEATEFLLSAYGAEVVNVDTA